MEMVLATVVIRNGDPEENGLIYEIDWKSRTIVHREVIPSPQLDDLGPRGGARGARGVVSDSGLHYVANFNTVFVFDENWRKVGEISHPLFNGLHEIEVVSDGLWVTSTGLDAVLKVDFHGNLLSSVFLGEIEETLREKLAISPRFIDKTADHRSIVYPNSELVTHVNTVKIYDDEVLISTNKQGTMLSLDTFEILSDPKHKSGFHNGTKVSDDLIIMNSSHEKKLLGFEPYHRESLFEFDWSGEIHCASGSDRRLIETVFSVEQNERVTAVAGWNRGLAVMANGHLLVGMAPAMIIEFAVDTQEVVSVFPISDDIHHAIHALTVFEG